ncbi:MAG: hypothetical protein GY820_39680 [Gammaproteobacteria bacterium]|nr:hypothetical protein [Gammaproteobacteria bacterium]
MCLMQLGCNPLAIEDTLEECIRVAERLAGEPIDRNEIDDHTDLHYLTTDDVVAVEIR